MHSPGGRFAGRLPIRKRHTSNSRPLTTVDIKMYETAILIEFPSPDAL
jgi:hypothetical protein